MRVFECLDLFAGEGGAGRGYAEARSQAGSTFSVTGVDNSRARLSRYPYEAHLDDALAYLAAHGHKFDFIHASPPCTGYSRGTAAVPDRLDRYDRLIPAVRDVLLELGVPYVIENVEDARTELITPLTLCWTHFNEPGSVTDVDGTPLWMRRHRVFESNVPLLAAGTCWHPQTMQCAGAYGGARRDKIEARTVRKGGYVPSVPVMQTLLGTPWMSEKGCQLSIPPAYTEWLGWQILETGLGA